MAGLNSVADLNTRTTVLRVRVLIVHLWKQPSPSGGPTIELVFIDSYGVKIHATVKSDLVFKFEKYLESGRSMILTNFTLSPVCGSYRTTSHRFKINFLSSSLVRFTDDLPIPPLGFTPVKFTDIIDGSLNADYLIDVIGHVVETGQIQLLGVNGVEIHKISLLIRDTDDLRLPVVLWGKVATDINRAIQQCGQQKLILVMRFAKIKVWKGVFTYEDYHTVGNAFNITDVKPNLIMEEVDAFRSMLPNDNLSIRIVDSTPTAEASVYSEKHDFLVRTPGKTLSELVECRQVEMCIVMCKIVNIDTEMGWYYVACQVCSRKVQYEPPLAHGVNIDDDVSRFKAYCAKCKCYGPKIYPRYKLHLVVEDNTGSSKLLIFDHLALQLVRRPCIELTGPVTDELRDQAALPMLIQDLIGKTYLFKVEILRENFVYDHDTFKVNKICTNDEIITEFHRRG